MSQFNTVLITKPEDFHALSSDWNTLLELSNLNNIFLTWEWLSGWYQHFGASQPLWIVAVRDAQTDQLLGIAPLICQPRKISAFISITELCFLGNGVGSDHCDFILAAKHTEPLIDEITGFIRTQPQPWDLIHLDGLREDSIAARVLQDLFQNQQQYPITCPYLDLPENWTDYLSTLNKKRRHKIGYYQRKLEQAYPGQVHFQQIKTQAELDQALPKLFSLHQQAQQAQGREGAFGEAKQQAFHRQICQKFLNNGWLRLYFLRVNDQAIAVTYCFNYRHRISFYTTGFDSEWSNHSPGQQIIYHTLQQSINEQAKVFDFLRGDEDYKFMMTKTIATEQRFIAPKSMIGKAIAWAFKQKKVIKK